MTHCDLVSDVCRMSCWNEFWSCGLQHTSWSTRSFAGRHTATQPCHRPRCIHWHSRQMTAACLLTRLPTPNPTGSFATSCAPRLRSGPLQLSKSVMNDLERRLLQRQQSGWFETFLVALLLLNCVERTCWLFRSWDDENFAQRVSKLRLLVVSLYLTRFVVAPGQASSILRQPRRSLL